jgi:predicted RND superfamily exporter protein
MNRQPWVASFSAWLFRWRLPLLAVFIVLTALTGHAARHLKIDASFKKSMPLTHPYMQTFIHYENEFGGANRVLVALRTTDADIFTPGFLQALKTVTDAVYFVPGIDRASVTSLFTPNVRFIEVVENGFTGGSVVPAGFRGSPQELAAVRANVIKSGRVGRLVANDFKGALVSAQLLEVDPLSNRKIDYAAVARELEAIRTRSQRQGLDIHIIGFAKAVGDIRDAAGQVGQFFGIAFALTTLLLYGFCRSWRLTALTLLVALLPVVWLLGGMAWLDLRIDPLSVLVPFLIFSIGVSHAIQMTQAWRRALADTPTPDASAAARRAFQELFTPGAMALLANALGFLVMLIIPIQSVRDLTIAASLGVSLMIVTNKLFLPICLSYIPVRVGSVRTTPPFVANALARLWRWLSGLALPRAAYAVLFGMIVVLSGAAVVARHLQTGDLGVGIPELRAEARYNRDVAAITGSFSIGVDVLSVIAQAVGVDDACTRFDVMDAIDRFEQYMRTVPGVRDTASLANAAKVINAGWNENNPRWRALSRNRDVLAQAVAPVDTGSGLLNADCSALPVLIFAADHQGTTLKRLVQAVKNYQSQNPDTPVRFLLAAGNLGVMAASNEAVEAAETVMLGILFLAISLLCWLEFRSWRAVLCIVLPLGVVAVFCNAAMACLNIGLKVATLPVVALGVGVGVDYGIYLYERMRHGLAQGSSLPEAYRGALKARGTAILFTALTMTLGVGSWLGSSLKFQADMGLLLAFMFFVNMLGALVLLPALAGVVGLRAGKAISTPCAERLPGTG